jgi:Integrase core domain
MLMLVRSIVSRLECRFRSRAVVELENLALRHQLHVLRRQRPGRLRLFTLDRLLWVWLYRLWPRCLEAMGVKEVVTAPRSPWQNAYVERVIGSIRCECLDHHVIFNERHLRRVLSS